MLGEQGAYALTQTDKERFLLAEMNRLVEWHMERCSTYRRFIIGNGTIPPHASLTEIPYVPVQMFKHYDLRSTDEPDVTVIKSSSTTGANPAKIYVDRQSAGLLKQSVSAIFQDYIGTERRPYLIFDAMSTARGKHSLSARGAGIMSLMPYASRFFFLADDVNGQLRLNRDRLREAVDYVRTHGNEFIAFGFTWVMYLVHRELAEMGMRFSGFSERSRFLHTGGWKKLASMAVEKPVFNELIGSVWGLSPDSVIDFYGMSEQVGVIYPDCAYGNKHVPDWAEIIIRDPNTLRSGEIGQVGLIQLMSLLPRASPSHSVITDDLGELVGIDDCPCGRRGKAFRFRGRAPRVELRGCGDIYSESMG